MKKITFIITFLLTINFSFGQIVAWDMDTNAGSEITVNATTQDANLITSTLSRGVGINPSGLGNAFSSNNFTTVGSTQATAIANNDYLQFQVSASVGYEVSLSTLDVNFRRSGTGPNNFLWQYSTDGVSFTDIDVPFIYNTTPTNGTAQTQVDLSTIPTLQNVPFGTVIIFRLYGWGATGTSGTFAIGRLTGDDLQIGGSVLPACTSTVTWNGAWSGTPDSTTEVIIAANYDTANGGAEVSFSACSLIINPGFRLTVNNGNFVEVENDVSVDGELFVETRGNFVQNNNTGIFTVNAGGEARVNKQTATKQNWLYYTYWSSPVVGETIADAFPDTDADRRFWFNAANYIDADGNDLDDDDNDWTIAAGGDIMLPGVGYAATSGRLGLYPGSDNASFEGPFNTGNISTAISYNALNITGSWNLIGNPYPSAIDFIALQSANSAVIDGAAYFWSQSLPPDSANPGNQVNNFHHNDYATFTVGTGGASGANGIIPTQYIPSGQSFFIAGLANNNVTFTNAMRMADGTSNNQFFKGSSSKKNTVINANKIWINLTSDNGVFNQILVGYVEGATNGNDGMSYDAPKLLASESAILYTTIENSEKIFVIQGKAENSLDENEVINLGFKTAIDAATIYTLSIAQLQGDFLNGNTTYLKDNLLNVVHDLSASDYTFTSEVGEFNNRFQLGFTMQSLSTDEINISKNNLSIINLDDDRVNFKTTNNSIKKVVIYDLLGRELYNLEGQSSSEIYTLSNLKNTIYIAKVELSNGAVITKKAIKK